MPEDKMKETPAMVAVAPTAHEAEKARVAEDAARALETQRQLIVQMRAAIQQPDSPEGVKFGAAYANERGTLVRQYIGEKAFPHTPEGKTTADMKDPYYGQEVEGMFDEYGDNMQKHRQYCRAGWVPVIDDSTGEHVQTRGGDHLYQRPIEFRVMQDRANREMRDAKMSAATIPGDALKQGGIAEGVAFDETTIKRGG